MSKKILERRALMYSDDYVKNIVIALLVAVFAIGGVAYAIVFSSWGFKTIAFIVACACLSFFFFRRVANTKYAAYHGTVTIKKSNLEKVVTENLGRDVFFFLVFSYGEKVMYHNGRSCLKIPKGTPYYIVTSLACGSVVHQAFKCAEYTLCPEFERIYKNSLDNKEETPI